MSSSSAEVMMTKTDRERLAKDFLAGAKWKLIFSRGSGKSVDGMKTRMRIYAAGCPHNSLREVQEMLAAEKPVTNPEVDGVAITGTYYHRTSWWAGKVGAPMSVTPGTVSIIRELTDDINLQNTNTVEDDCGNTTTIRFVWDAESIEDVSTIDGSGDQGFQVRIGGVNRDSETGYYSYYVTTTERKYLHVPEHVVGEDALSTSYSEAWLGMRGTIAAPTDDEGNPVSVLNPDTFEQGVTKRTSWRKNAEDCTNDAEGNKTVAKRNVLTSERCDKDIFREIDVTETSAQAAKLGHAAEPANGLKQSHKSDLRPDGLFNNTVGKEQERKVVNAQEAGASDAFKSSTSATQSNIPVAEVPSLPAPGNGFTHTLRIEKTPGDLRNATLATDFEKDVSNARVSREDTILKEETTVESIALAPLGNPPPAGGGVITAHVDELTPGGKYRRRAAVRRAKAAASWVVTTITTWLGKTTSTKHVNQPAPLITDMPPTIGIRRELRKSNNEDGTFEHDLSETESVQRETGVLLASRDQYFDEVVAVTKNRRGAIQANPSGGTSGLTSGARSNLQEDGTFDATEQLKTEKPVQFSRKETDQTLYGKRITERHAHQSGEVTLDGNLYGGYGYEKTPGGLLNTSKTYWDLAGIPAEGRVLKREKGGTVTMDYEDIDRFFATDPGYGKTGLVLADGNVIYTSTITAHESGGFIRSDRAVTPRKNITEYISKTYIYTQENSNGDEETVNLQLYIFSFTNLEWAELAATVGGFVSPANLSISWKLNEFWLYNGEVSWHLEQITAGT